MSWYEAAALLIGMILFFMGLGMPVAFAFLAADIVGALIFMASTSTPVLLPVSSDKSTPANLQAIGSSSAKTSSNKTAVSE